MTHSKVVSEHKLPGYSRCCRTMVEVSKEDDTAGALHHLMDPLDLIGLLFIPTRELRGANCGRNAMNVIIYYVFWDCNHKLIYYSLMGSC